MRTIGALLFGAATIIMVWLTISSALAVRDFWEIQRPVAICFILMALAFAVGTIVGGLMVRRILRRQPIAPARGV